MDSERDLDRREFRTKPNHHQSTWTMCTRQETIALLKIVFLLATEAPGKLKLRGIRPQKCRRTAEWGGAVREDVVINPQSYIHNLVAPFRRLLIRAALDRGRDTGYPMPPAQIPARGFPAPIAQLREPFLILHVARLPAPLGEPLQ
jgi:hypothetical protein